MLKLKKITAQLDESAYNHIEGLLKKTKADNFLFLFQSYRNNLFTDVQIAEKLTINSNSFYVLKSRLYDKIQSHLSGGNTALSKENILKQLEQVTGICYNTPRETAVAFLQKLEQDLLAFDMHGELLVIYSALKKIHLNSEKYFHYSQLYNKHIAFGLSLEKAEDILGNFNRILAQYDFSKSRITLDKLLFLRKEILDHYALTSSRQIELIKNIIELQLFLFCGTDSDKELDITDKLLQTKKIIDDLPESSPYRNWEVTLDFLCFEHFRKTGRNKLATESFEKVMSLFPNFLLYNSICLVSKFLILKIRFLQDQNKLDLFIKDTNKQLLFDNDDMHAKVSMGIYFSMHSYYLKKYKDAITKLNEVINLYSFKDYFHINLEVKLTLAFLYIKIEEYVVCDTILKSIQRKIKSENMENYFHVLELIKVFTIDTTKIKDKKSSSKQRDSFTLFMARNKNENVVLQHLSLELEKIYL